MAVFREYTSDDSFTEIDDISAYGVSEFQVALTFARDRDGEDSTNGKFIPSWDTTRVTPQVIKNFKNRFPSAKVLVSIGVDKRDFPFKTGELIREAIESLTRIIQKYNLDGVDVYYEDIDTKENYYLPLTNPDIFVESVGEVIKKLKDNNVITRASISANIDTYEECYLPLYQRFENFIDHVVFQCFTSGVAENNNRSDHNVLFENFKNYDPKKFLLGYTGIREDWPLQNVLFPPPLFFVNIVHFLNRGFIIGASIKVTRWSITYFPPQWILDVLLAGPPLLNQNS